MKWVILTAGLLILSGCGSAYERQISQIEWFFSLGKTGGSSDYMLVKYGFAGRNPVAVIFGFMDDMAFCNEVAQLYMQKYPSDKYACERIN